MEKKTSQQWYDEIPKDFGFIIYDPDGWDRSNYEYSFNEELITKEEFLKRVTSSTCLCKRQLFEWFTDWSK